MWTSFSSQIYEILIEIKSFNLGNEMHAWDDFKEMFYFMIVLNLWKCFILYTHQNVMPTIRIMIYKINLQFMLSNYRQSFKATRILSLGRIFFEYFVVLFIYSTTLVRFWYEINIKKKTNQTEKSTLVTTYGNKSSWCTVNQLWGTVNP